MVPCLVTLSDLLMRSVGLSASAELLVYAVLTPAFALNALFCLLPKMRPQRRIQSIPLSFVVRYVV